MSLVQGSWWEVNGDSQHFVHQRLLSRLEKGTLWPISQKFHREILEMRQSLRGLKNSSHTELPSESVRCESREDPSSPRILANWRGEREEGMWMGVWESYRVDRNGLKLDCDHVYTTL